MFDKAVQKNDDNLESPFMVPYRTRAERLDALKRDNIVKLLDQHSKGKQQDMSAVCTIVVYTTWTKAEERALKLQKKATIHHSGMNLLLTYTRLS